MLKRYDKYSYCFSKKGMNMEELFKKLYDYIEPFDSEWGKRIKPASKKLIEHYIEMTGLKDYVERIPTSYLKFLELMGEDSGGLISWEDDFDTANIRKIKKYIKEYRAQYKSDLNKKRFPICIDTMMRTMLFFNLEKENSKEIWTENGNTIEQVSENFEKYLFQCAFDNLIEYEFKKCFSLNKDEIQSIIKEQNVSSEEVYKNIIYIIERYGIKETWFSSPKYYRGESRNIIISIMQYNSSIYVNIESKSRIIISSIKKEIRDFYMGQIL